MDAFAGAPSGDAAAPRPSPPSFPAREDCWSEDATFSLLDAWGDRYLDLNRGNLRQKHWQEVADEVNLRHGLRRTDVQCKNRIDTLKKKFKIEKARVHDSDDGDGYSGSWPFFRRLDFLIGDTFPAKGDSPPAMSADRRKTPPKPPAWAVPPVGPRSGTQKRAPGSAQFRRNFCALAAAAAAESDKSDGWKRRKKGRESDDDGDWELGYREVAIAIERFGEIYERVEAEKQRQMVELEKQRMQFAKDLECHRMQLFMETQLELHKINHSNPTG